MLEIAQNRDKLKHMKVLEFICLSTSAQNRLNEFFVFEERGKPEYVQKNFSELSREPTKSTHTRSSSGIAPTLISLS